MKKVSAQRELCPDYSPNLQQTHGPVKFSFFRPNQKISYPILFVDPENGSKELEELATVVGASIIHIEDKAHLVELIGSPVLPALALDPNKIAYGERTCKLFLQALAEPTEDPIKPRDLSFDLGGN